MSLPQYVRPRAARQILRGIGNATLWRWVKELPDFPRPIKLGPNVTVFAADELRAFVDKQRAAA